MFGFRSLAVGSSAALVLAMSAPVAQAAQALYFAPATSSDGAASTDWSGWDVTGDTYNSVSAAWTVPTVTCTSGETSYSADWVGLDGDGSDSVEQTGTSSDCDNGVPTYSAWYEFYPSVSVSLTDKVKAGDKITAAVTAVAGTDRFKLVLTDTTAKWTKTQTGESPSGTGASAEIITEAPSGSERSNSVLPLADFKQVTFSDVKVNGAALTGSGVQKIAMVDDSGDPMTTVTALSDAGQFSVSWLSSGDSGSAAQFPGQGSTGQGETGSGSSDSGSWGYSGGWGSGSDGDGYTGDGNGDSSDGYGYGNGYGNGYGYGYGYSGYGDGYGDNQYGDSSQGSDGYGYGYGYGYSSTGAGDSGTYWQS